MILEILGGLGGLIGGPLFGIIGSGMQAWIEQKKRDRMAQHELEMKRLNMDEIRLEADLALRQIQVQNEGRAQLANIEADAARDVADAALQQASYQADRATYSTSVADKLTGAWGTTAAVFLALVDVLRGLVRPVLTFAMVSVLLMITWDAWQMAQALEAVTASEKMRAHGEYQETFLMLTSTVVVWWFGSRMMKRGKD